MDGVVVREIVGRAEHSAEAFAGAGMDNPPELASAEVCEFQLPVRVMCRPSARTKPETWMRWRSGEQTCQSDGACCTDDRSRKVIVNTAPSARIATARRKAPV
jgi:hypothetical protein